MAMLKEKLTPTQLSNVALKCYRMDRQEVMDFKLPVELSFAEAKKLMGYTDGITKALGIISDEKQSISEKEKAVKDLKNFHRLMAAFALKRKECFEARKVIIMCEMNMLYANIDPKKIDIDFDVDPSKDD